MKQQFKSLAAKVIVVSCFACSPNNTSTSTATSVIVPYKAGNGEILKLPLGAGYDSALLKLASPCVVPTTVNYLGIQSATLDFLYDYNSEQLAKETNVSISGNISILEGALSGSASGEYSQKLASDEQTTTIIYKYNIYGKSIVGNDFMLTDLGQSAYERKDPVYLRKTCGDEYLEQINLTAQLYIAAKIYFSNKDTKEKLNAQVKGQALWGAIKKTKTWSKDDAQIVKNTWVKIDAYQVGGNPSILQELLKTNSAGCNLSETENCAKLLDLLIEYAAGDKGLSAQLDDMTYSSTKNSGLAPMNYVTKSFKDSYFKNSNGSGFVHFDVQQGLNSQVALRNAMENLTRTRDKLVAIQQKADDFLHLSPSIPEQEKINQIKSTALNDQNRVENILNKSCKFAIEDNFLQNDCISQSTAIILEIELHDFTLNFTTKEMASPL